MSWPTTLAILLNGRTKGLNFLRKLIFAALILSLRSRTKVLNFLWKLIFAALILSLRSRTKVLLNSTFLRYLVKLSSPTFYSTTVITPYHFSSSSILWSHPGSPPNLWVMTLSCPLLGDFTT